MPRSAPADARRVDPSALQTALLLFVASLVGALLPLYRRWSDRGLHVFVALAAGIFLGTIFLQLLPHLAGVEVEGHPHGPEPEGVHGLLPWIAALAGLLVLFAVERVWLPSWTRGSSADPHTSLWTATFLGLSVHAITAGVALSAILADPDARMQFLASMLIHKATETFSLATVMRLANLGRTRTIALLLCFAAIEPAGLLFGSGLMGIGHGLDAVLTGLACGTFLYVAVCDLLPEVFHGAERPVIKLVAVVVGVLLTALSLPGLSVAVDFAVRVLRASVDVFIDFAPFLLLGFLIAGILAQVLRTERLVRHVKEDDLKSVGVAALIGAPLPLCSCAVVPVAVELRRGGASKGATSAFLIATPETGVDSVTVTWALLDPVMTIARPIGAVLSAVFTGACVNALVRRGWDRSPPKASSTLEPDAARSTAAAGCCAHVHPEAPGAPRPVARIRAVAAEPAPGLHAHTHGHEHGHEHGHAPAASTAPDADECCAREPEKTTAGARPRPLLVRVLRHAFVDMLDDLSSSLLVGTLLSGAIAVLVPAELFAHPATRGLGGMLLMLAIGIPMYVCAAASTPIAATLILKGMSPGAAFVFLLASPATNLGSLLALRKHLGGRVVLVHVAALAVVTLLLGAAVDLVYALLARAPSASVGTTHEHGNALGVACAVLLAGLMLASLVRTHGGRNLLAKLAVEPEPSAT